MVIYTYKCCKCGKDFDVTTFGRDVIIDSDYDNPAEIILSVKCPKCGGKVCCTYNPRFDDFE